MAERNFNIGYFVEKHESRLKWFRRLYRLLDFIAISVFLYTIFVIFNIDTIFSSIKSFELYTGRQFHFAGFSVLFETIGLIVISLTVALIISLIIHKYSDKTNAIQIIESKYPQLSERLRTAYDNRNNSNIIVNDLINSVMEYAKNVKSLDLLNRKRFASSIMAVLVAVSLFSVITIYDYNTDIKPVDMSRNIFAPEDDRTSDELPVTDNQENDDKNQENVQGETSIVVVEGEKIDLKLSPGSGKGFTNQQEGNDNQPFEPSSAYDINVISSKAYYENLPERYQSVIKQYFEEMAKK